jgi:hypothetical protein
MAYAGIEDIEVDYGPVPDAEAGRVLALIERVEAQISQRVPDLAARITAGRTTENLVRQVVSELVTVKLRNPEGYMQRSHTVTKGPYSESTSGTIAGGVAGGGGQPVLTRRHLRFLGCPAGAQTVPLADDALPYVPRAPVGSSIPDGTRVGLLWPAPIPANGTTP